MSRGRSGMVSVAGGKLTTWRLIGARAARLALAPLGLPGAGAARGAPGAAPLAAIERGLAESHPKLPADVRTHLARHYGTRSAAVLAPGG